MRRCVCLTFTRLYLDCCLAVATPGRWVKFKAICKCMHASVTDDDTVSTCWSKLYAGWQNSQVYHSKRRNNIGTDHIINGMLSASWLQEFNQRLWTLSCRMSKKIQRCIEQADCRVMPHFAESQFAENPCHLLIFLKRKCLRRQTKLTLTVTLTLHDTVTVIFLRAFRWHP